jgi:hypothetical protein
MSTDSGATWDETFLWSGSPPTSLDAAVLANHLYVAYNSPGDDAQQVRLRRFLCSNGRADTFGTGGSWVVPCTLVVGDTMKEVALVSRESGSSTWLYLTTLVSDGSVLFICEDKQSGSWYKRSTGIMSGASNGLDATGNLNSDSIHVFFSYYDTSDTLRVYGYGSGGCKQRCARFAGRGTPTSISACHDTIICAYEDETTSPYQVRYLIKYRDSDVWRMGTLSSVDTAAECPTVTVRGGAFAAAFRHCSPARELRFRSRTFYGAWSDPVSVADHEPCWARPEIAYLGAGVYGVVYLSNTSPVVRGAYFDRSDWVYGLAEQRQPQASSRTSLATVVRGVLFLPSLGTRSELPERNSVMSRAALLDISGREVMDLRPGANDVSHLVPGVYFVRSAREAAAQPHEAAVSRQPSAVAKVVVTR